MSCYGKALAVFYVININTDKHKSDECSSNEWMKFVSFLMRRFESHEGAHNIRS